MAPYHERTGPVGAGPNANTDQIKGPPNSNPPKPDRDAILETLATLFEPTDVIELRAFPKGQKQTAAGYFDGEHWEDLAYAAAKLNGASNAAAYVNPESVTSSVLPPHFTRP